MSVSKSPEKSTLRIINPNWLATIMTFEGNGYKFNRTHETRKAAVIICIGNLVFDVGVLVEVV